jgi:diguanylate cyclase (GGDEF)-like protein/PAS domain S-box-containing protein
MLMYAPSPESGGDAFVAIASLLDALSTLVAYADTTHRLLYANDALARAFQSTKAQLRGHDVRTLLLASGRAAFASVLDSVVTGNHISEERRIDAIARETVWWRIDYYPNRERSGRVVGYYIFGADISAAKALEVATEERGAQVRRLVESVVLPIARWDRNARLVFCNTPYERWVGKPRSEILGKTLTELFGAAAWTAAKSSFEQAYAGRAATYERQVLQVDHDLRWHRVQVFPEDNASAAPETVFTIAFDIEDDTRLRQQLASNEARLRSVLESIDVPIARVSVEATFVYCNESFSRFVAKAPEEIVGHTVESFFGSKLRDHVAPYFERALNGETVSFDRQSARLGPSRWLRVRLLPERDASGYTRAVLCSIYDIDADVRTREKLELARKQLDDFATAIPFPLTYIDRDERYRFANRVFLERHDLQIEQIIGAHPSDARGKTVWEEYKPYLDKALAGVPAIYERPVLLANGERRWTRTSYSPDFAPDGSVRGVYTASVDIHELMLARVEVARVEAKLGAHLARGPVAVVEYDRNGRIVEWSRRSEELLGYAREDMVGTRLSIDIVHPDDRIEVEGVIARILSAKTETVINTHRYRHRDGHHIWIEWYTSIVRSENSDIQSILSLGIDRTERTEARLKLQRLADRIPNPITYVGVDMRYQFMNQAFTDWIGVTPEQMIGKTPSEVRGAVLGGVFEGLIARALAGEEAFIERLVTLADGTTRWLKTLIAPDFDDEDRIVGCYNVSFDIHETKLREEMLKSVANHDPLTHALTRRALFERLDEMLQSRDGGAVTLLFVDLDGFKAINDRLGHAAGDAVLIKVVSRLRACITEKDLLGRLGGDEFVIVTRAVTRRDAQIVGDAIIAAVAGMHVDGHPDLRLSVSVGSAQALCTATAISSDELLQRADHAMYRAKREGGSRLRFAD